MGPPCTLEFSFSMNEREPRSSVGAGRPAVNPENLTLVVAFGAGVLSFASPCVLPLVPAYVGHLAGQTLEQ